jgi:hypothetical protein
MPDHTVFLVIFFCQVILVSLYLPWKILAHLAHVLETHPPADYPKLYPRPVEHYARSRRRFRALSLTLAAVGLALLVWLGMTPGSREWASSVAMVYFFLQLAPMGLLDWSQLREARLMQVRSAVRRASLERRRLRDYVPPGLFGAAVITWAGFVVLIAWLRQFDYPWFGGWWNVVGITIGNLILGAIAVQQINRPRRNPHEASADRKVRTRALVTAMLLTSIAATVFVSLNIGLAAFDQRGLQPAATSVYFQLLAVIMSQIYLVRAADYEAYRDDPATV